jgi:hypothetical protein
MRGTSARTPGVAVTLPVGFCYGKFVNRAEKMTDPLTIIVDGGAITKHIPHSLFSDSYLECNSNVGHLMSPIRTRTSGLLDRVGLGARCVTLDHKMFVFNFNAVLSELFLFR